MGLEDSRAADEQLREVEVLRVLQQLWTYAKTARSDIAREFAEEIAEAASRGFITTEVVPGGGLYGKLWKLTPAGLSFLWAKAHLIEVLEEKHYVERHTVQEQRSGEVEGSRGEAGGPD